MDTSSYLELAFTLHGKQSQMRQLFQRYLAFSSQKAGSNLDFSALKNLLFCLLQLKKCGIYRLKKKRRARQCLTGKRKIRKEKYFDCCRRSSEIENRILLIRNQAFRFQFRCFTQLTVSREETRRPVIMVLNHRQRSCKVSLHLAIKSDIFTAGIIFEKASIQFEKYGQTNLCYTFFWSCREVDLNNFSASFIYAGTNSP